MLKLIWIEYLNLLLWTTSDAIATSICNSFETCPDITTWNSMVYCEQQWEHWTTPSQHLDILTHIAFAGGLHFGAFVSSFARTADHATPSNAIPKQPSGHTGVAEDISGTGVKNGSVSSARILMSKLENGKYLW